MLKTRSFIGVGLLTAFFFLIKWLKSVPMFELQSQFDTLYFCLYLFIY